MRGEIAPRHQQLTVHPTIFRPPAPIPAVFDFGARFSRPGLTVVLTVSPAFVVVVVAFCRRFDAVVLAPVGCVTLGTHGATEKVKPQRVSDVITFIPRQRRRCMIERTSQLKHSRLTTQTRDKSWVLRNIVFLATRSGTGSFLRCVSCHSQPPGKRSISTERLDLDLPTLNSTRLTFCAFCATECNFFH